MEEKENISNKEGCVGVNVCIVLCSGCLISGGGDALTSSPAGPRGPSLPVFPGGPRGPGGPGAPGGPAGPAWPWSP